MISVFVCRSNHNHPFHNSSEDENALLLKLSHHTSSCRGVLFDTTGDTLYTISSDMSIKGVNSAGQVHITYRFGNMIHNNYFLRDHIIIIVKAIL